jgi:hypothetical protein
MYTNTGISHERTHAITNEALLLKDDVIVGNLTNAANDINKYCPEVRYPTCLFMRKALLDKGSYFYVRNQSTYRILT